MADVIVARPTPWVREVTRDAVRHFAWGIGDNNPLWLDPVYAAGTGWGGIIAPPCFAYAADETTVAPGLDGHRRVYQSVQWTWFDVFRPGQPIDASACLLSSEPAEQNVFQTGRVEFRAGAGQIIARALCQCLRLPADSIPTDGPEEPPYAAEELEAIERSILAERRRGDEIRYFEDVRIGDPLEARLKGPLSIIDIVAWRAATQGIAAAESEESEGGIGDARASGPQRVSWASQLITDWIGDAGFLHRLNVEFCGDAALGSTTAWQGAVADAKIDNGLPSVELSLSATNQRGELTATGSAVVLLRSRDHGPVVTPLDAQLVVGERPA